MRESSFTADVAKRLKAAGALTFKIHGGPYGRAGVPDMFVADTRWSGWIEFKVGRNKVTPVQQAAMYALTKRGVNAVVLRATEEELLIEDADGTRRASLPWRARERASGAVLIDALTRLGR